GELYARFRITEDNYFTAGRYTYDTPYLSRFDIRMTPYTFQGYVLQGSAGGGDGQPSIRYGAGYISDVKPWTSEGFISMSRAAGANVDRGVASAGALFSFQNFSVGAIDYYSSDIINIGYAEAKYVTRLPEKLDVMLSTQYVDQRSVGSDLARSGPTL